MSDFLNNAAYFGAFLTVALYILACLVRKRFKLAILNPLLLAALCIIAIVKGLHLDMARYQQQSQMISWLLTPATVCLAIPLYEKLSLLKKHWKAVAAGLLAGLLTSFVCVLGLAALFRLDHSQYVSFLPKSITTAIGMALSQELGGNVSVTVALICFTGVFGSILSEAVFRLFRIREPIAQGVALGTSAHAIGTARANELGETQGAMSSLALVVTGVATVLLSSFMAQAW